ncbi:cache domain-containing protein [Limimaricola soesokkakensis]|uniref:cache domain-containing protein n=1 Tax=Limimaricola soesokkakensis TaxID=1343159 RepID=UPI0035117881
MAGIGQDGEGTMQNWAIMGKLACAGLALAMSGVLAGGAKADAAAVDALAERAAAAIGRLHSNAQRALVTVAQDEAFADYFHTHESSERHRHKSRIDEVSLATQDKFHVEEMCLIDPQGAEISRIVGDEIAHDLATDEADAPFFAPGFAADHRQVYTSPIYLSPDADKWVVAYVTPVLVDGDKRSILHYEHAFTAYGDILQRLAANDEGEIMIVADTGHVIFDSRRQIPTERVGELEDRDDYFDGFDFAGLDLAGFRQAIGQDATRGQGRITGQDVDRNAAFRVVGPWTLIGWQDL